MNIRRGQASVLVVLLGLLCTVSLGRAQTFPPPLWIQLHTAATASGNGVVQNLGNTRYGAVTLQVVTTGGFNGTLTPQTSTDHTNFNGVLCRNQTATTYALTITAAGTYVCLIPGADIFQAVLSGISAGSVTVTAEFTWGAFSFIPPAAAGATASTDLTDSADLARKSTANIFLMQQAINLNAAAAPTPAIGTGMQLTGTDTTTARFEVDTFGAVGGFTVRRADGTNAARSAVQNTEQLGFFNFHGAYDGTNYSGPQATVAAYATENWTSTTLGTKLVLRTTPNGSTTLTDALTIGQDGSGAFAGAVSGTALTGSTALIGPGTPATAGDVRLKSGFGLLARNAANTLDLNVLRIDSSDQILLGGNTRADTSGNRSGILKQTTFAPTSGNFNYVGVQFNPIINATGTTAGAFFTSFVIAPVLTSTTGTTVTLFDIGTTTTDYFTGFTSLFKVTAAGQVTHAGTVQTGTVAPLFKLTGAAHTALTASTARPSVSWDFSASQQWATGAGPTVQATIDIAQPGALTAVGASTFPEAATWYIRGAPPKGTNVVLTQTEALRVDGGAVSTVGTAYAAVFTAPTGATTNIPAYFSSGVAGLLSRFETTANNQAYISIKKSGADWFLGTDISASGGTNFFLYNNTSGNAAIIATSVGNVGIGYGASTGLVAEKLMVAGNVVLGGGDGGTPTASTVRGASAAGANIAGMIVTRQASLGTGTGNEGTLDFSASLGKNTTGSTAHTASVIQRIGNSQSAHPGLAGFLVSHPALTITDENTAGSGTAATAVAFSYLAPTFAARNTLTTVTDATTAYFAAPLAGTNVTATNLWGTWNAGNERIDGTVVRLTNIKSTTGQRYLCVDTAGNVTAVATTCTGT